VDGVRHDGQHAATHLARPAPAPEAPVATKIVSRTVRRQAALNGSTNDRSGSANSKIVPEFGPVTDRPTSLTVGPPPENNRGRAPAGKEPPPAETSFVALTQLLATRLVEAERRAEEIGSRAAQARDDAAAAQGRLEAQAERIGNADGRAEEALHQAELARTELGKALRRSEVLSERLGKAEGRAIDALRQLDLANSELAKLSAALLHAREDAAAAWEHCVLVAANERSLRELYNRLLDQVGGNGGAGAPPAPSGNRIASIRQRFDRPTAN
jgi:hypothetical protein